MTSETVQVLPADTVLILGGGPVGMMTATVLSFYDVKSVVLERNFTTTKWPKMDLTNVRSMEIFRKLGLSEGLRRRGVPSHIPYTVLVSSGLSRDSPITQWNHPSVDKYFEMIQAKNDGTMPLEPWQRISQEIFEAWLKELSEHDPLIDIRFGWKLESILETERGVEATVTDLNKGKTVQFKAQYAVGCDGASSRVRRSLDISLDGGPVPGYVLLVHFKSNDLARLHKHGRFWHLFIARDGHMGGAAISQDEKDTFTTHLFLPMDVDESKITTEEAVYRVFGGQYEPYEVKIDRVLVRSTYRPSIAVARVYSSSNGRIYLAGDSAHQNIPTGGYGMNMGLGDAYDIGWKLAGFIQGWARKGLLQSYTAERRPVALTNVERSGVHMAVHSAVPQILGDYASELDRDSDKGRELREAIHQHYQANDGENTDMGIEMGYRYRSNIIVPDKTEVEPEWNAHTYHPTTWPGSRPPHVFLKDGSAMFDHFGKYYTLVHFVNQRHEDGHSKYFVEAAATMGIPLKVLSLLDEGHARSLWERDMVLIRPDGHVSWRANGIDYRSTAYFALEVATGFRSSLDGTLEESMSNAPVEAESTSNGQNSTHTGYHTNNKTPVVFTSTEGVTSQTKDYKMAKMGHFQE